MFREAGNLKHLYRNELEKAHFAQDATYSDSNDLAKRTISDKILKDRADEIVTNCKYDRYQRALGTMFYKFFDKKTETGESENELLAEELHKQQLKHSKEEDSLRDLTIIFPQQM